MLSASRIGHAENPVLTQQLLSGGDARIELNPVSGLNAYGCSPAPRGGVCDFSSSTASSISPTAFARIQQTWHRFERQDSFDGLSDGAREELGHIFGLRDQDVDIIFSRSGTDAQLLALFLVSATLGAPLVTIIVGADQTGSGTVHTSRGRHFIDRGLSRKGDAVAGLPCGIESVSIPFCAPNGTPRTGQELDEAVVKAAEVAIAKGAYVLLQAMAASKLGWSSPTSVCIAELQRRWPDRIRVVMDACQMRTSAARLRGYLAQGYLVLMTGSKFFCGPAFSGAVLVPASLRGALAAITRIPFGVRSLGSSSDWPGHFPALRSAFSPEPNIGQCLRWEAALEEMRTYHSVPLPFRTRVLRRFANEISALIAGSSFAALYQGSVADPDLLRDGEFAVPTIFPMVLHHPDRVFVFRDYASIYRLLNQDISSFFLAGADRILAARLCHIGQPVETGSETAVLRLSSSARIVVQCWSPDPMLAEEKIAAKIKDAAACLDKLGLIVRNFSRLTT